MQHAESEDIVSRTILAAENFFSHKMAGRAHCEGVSLKFRCSIIDLGACHAALIYKLKQHAMKKCESRAKAYAECAEGRTVSVVWACRQHLNDLNACLKQW